MSAIGALGICVSRTTLRGLDVCVLEYIFVIIGGGVGVEQIDNRPAETILILNALHTRRR